MKATLKTGRTVEYTTEPMSTGAEGQIYKATSGNTLVKLYATPTPGRQRQLELIIDSYNAVEDNPFWSKYFCWPTDVVLKPQLGLIMPKAPDSYRPLTWFLSAKTRQRLTPEERGDWQKHLGIAIKLSWAIRRLHQKGLCHADLSHNNCLVDLRTASLMIIDLDGLVVPGFMPPNVYGTPDFMAPEIMAGGVEPSRFTDLHALAVLLYRILLFSHPLRGPKLHANSAEQDNHLAMGQNALYIEHPTDRSNRPKILPLTSNMLGEQVRTLFMEAFVDGLHNPSKRPSASRWEEALTRLSDLLVPCTNLHCEGKFYPFVEGQTKQCPFCNTPKLSVPLMLLDLYRPVSGRQDAYRNDNWTLISQEWRFLHEWHIHPDRSPGETSNQSPEAVFIFDKKTAGWYFQNNSESSIYVCDHNHNWHEIPSREMIVLEDGLRIKFDNTGTSRIGVVRASYKGG